MTNGRGRGRPYLADRADIEQWADRNESRTEFPRLVRTLIRQTNDQVVELNMRAAEGVDLPGYDGIIEATRGAPFVPQGKSVWELGTGGNPQDKANKDFKKRTGDPLGVDPTTTTFVFVTLREFRDKEAWSKERLAEGKWHDVKVFDVDDIELALESAPAAHVWFSEVIGKPASGVQTIEDWWDRFRALSNPALTPGLVLAGRADPASELLRILDLESQVTSISAASTDDVLAFVAAALLTSPAEGRLDLLAKTLIVRDAITLRHLDAASGLLVILPFEDDLRREAELVKSHHVILLAPQDVPSQISLPPIDRDAFVEELERLGVPGELRPALSDAAYRSIVAFQRQAPAVGRAPRPGWSEMLRSRIVRRAWLVGAWSERRSGDLDALSELFGRSYDEARDELTEAARGADPLFSVTGDSWSVVAPLEVWEHGRTRLAGGDLVALETVIQTVLGAVDPALELPAEDRWKAAIYGKTRVHSADLRRGLATSLALLGAYGDSLNLGGGKTARSWTEGVVFSLLDRSNQDASGQLWSSLSDVLPLLAEAAPDVFLRAVQEGVSGANPVLGKMFVDQGEALSVNSPHTGLLWALETLAWSELSLGMAAELLARLAEIDPGGRLSNRPAASLLDIFRPWLPQTSASAESRLAVLDAIRTKHEAVGWSLLLGLLPESHAVGGYTHSPVFRDWKPPPPDEAGKPHEGEHGD